MLIHNLESFTDSLAVVQNAKPIGILGGKEIIEGVFHNPSSRFFDNTNVEKIMSKNLKIVTEQTKLEELLEYWTQTRRAFAIIPNKMFGYSALSARKLLEIVLECKTGLYMSDLPKKDIGRFKKDDSIADIIGLMLEFGTRKILYEESSKFVSDRQLIQHIAKNLNYLRGIDNFLDLTLDPTSLDQAKVVYENLKISKLAKIMNSMQHPYVLFEEQVITPWDMCISLLSDKLEVVCKS
jgi:predicted transcriptional regulator